jgi:hypothetical protein
VTGSARCVTLGIVGVVALMAQSGVSLAARETTSPGLAPVTVYVTETDRGITYTMWQSVIYEGQPSQVVASALLRGEVAIFQVSNKGKKRHNFSAFGKTTPKLASGAKARFKVALIHRGTFPYRSTIDKGKPGFRGVLKVY